MDKRQLFLLALVIAFFATLIEIRAQAPDDFSPTIFPDIKM